MNYTELTPDQRICDKSWNRSNKYLFNVEEDPEERNDLTQNQKQSNNCEEEFMNTLDHSLKETIQKNPVEVILLILAMFGLQDGVDNSLSMFYYYQKLLGTMMNCYYVTAFWVIFGLLGVIWQVFFGQSSFQKLCWGLLLHSPKF